MRDAQGNSRGAASARRNSWGGRGFSWRGGAHRLPARLLSLPFLLLLCSPGLTSPAPDSQSSGDEGIALELDAPEADVLKAVEYVANDQIVHGTYVYEKDKTLTGAVAENSSAYYGHWEGRGQAFFKVLHGAIAPRHFKNSSDIGTLTVRYVVQPGRESRTRLWVEAVFVEDGRRKVHPSDGSVESSEIKEIQERLGKIRLEKQQAAESLKHRQEQESADAILARQREEERSRLLVAQSAAQGLEQRVNALRHEVVRLVVRPGADLKSAPFQSAVSLQSVPAETEVLILIVTPYWFGVETPQGHRGWLRRDQVKQLP